MLCRVCLKPESTAEVNFAEGTQWCVCLHACAPKMNLGRHKQCVSSSVHSIRHLNSPLGHTACGKTSEATLM